MNKKNRLKLNQSATALKSRDQVETVLREIAQVTLKRNQAQLKMDELITNIRTQYEELIGDCTTHLESQTELIRAWAEANPSEFKGKSADFVHAQIGWRTGQPTLKTLAGWTWDRVLEKLKGLPNLLQYIRIKEEVNKQSIIGDREGFGPDGLRLIGVRVVQEESFFIEPKLSEIENKQQIAA
jgi:phage host-nuclease inhibitor protein Gam